MGRADVHSRADFSTLRPLNTTIRVEELLEMVLKSKEEFHGELNMD